MKGKWKQIFSVRYGDRAALHRRDRGSVLPMVMGLGTIMMLAGAVLIVQSQQGQSLAKGRTHSGNSLAVAEGGVARTLALLTKPNNTVLLLKNYDPINPQTGTTYLGADGILSSGDEENTAVSNWKDPSSTVPKCGEPTGISNVDLPYEGTIGNSGRYKLLAYRYNLREKIGSLLVEGKDGNANAAYILVKVPFSSTYSGFPGLLAIDITLAGRKVIGHNGNVGYERWNSHNPTVTGYALPNSPQRSQYLAAINSSIADNVMGNIIACVPQAIYFPYTPPPEAVDLGGINSTRQIANTSGAIESYRVSNIILGKNSILTVDTTAGPVHIYVKNHMNLSGNAQIRNVRSDGKKPQVGDLRLIFDANFYRRIDIKDKVCIDTAFLWKPMGYTYFSTTGDGCPSNGNTNFDGVLWSAGLIFTNNSSNSGISAPADLSSLTNIAEGLNFHFKIQNQLSSVKSWQRVQL